MAWRGHRVYTFALVDELFEWALRDERHICLVSRTIDSQSLTVVYASKDSSYIRKCMEQANGPTCVADLYHTLSQDDSFQAV